MSTRTVIHTMTVRIWVAISTTSYMQGLSNEWRYKFDNRIGYIRYRKGHIIILESDKFHARTELTDKVVRNWHHYFIDITDRDVSKLVLVLDEPMEIVRRPQVLLMTIQ